MRNLIKLRKQNALLLPVQYLGALNIDLTTSVALRTLIPPTDPQALIVSCRPAVAGRQSLRATGFLTCWPVPSEKFLLLPGLVHTEHRTPLDSSQARALPLVLVASLLRKKSSFSSKSISSQSPLFPNAIARWFAIASLVFLTPPDTS